MAEVTIRHSKAAVLVFAILAAATVLAAIWVWPWITTTTVILVRHAEKEAGGAGNPSLTDAGDARAVELAEVAGEAGVSAIYATEFCRTVLTARPLAEALDLPIRVQQSPHGGLEGAACTPPIPPGLIDLLPADNDTAAELIAHVVANNRKGVVLVVGHSNTVPDLVGELGGGALDEIADLSTYDRLFVVTRHSWLLAPRLIKARYGQP